MSLLLGTTLFALGLLLGAVGTLLVTDGIGQRISAEIGAEIEQGIMTEELAALALAGAKEGVRPVYIAATELGFSRATDVFVARFDGRRVLMIGGKGERDT